MHIMCCNNLIIQCIPFSTVLCGKLCFPISFTHCLILIFCSCPIVLLSSVFSTKSSLSIFFNIIYHFVHCYLVPTFSSI
ncbi:hypothetical protein E2C01_099103 [Portunus trituberculatus]|uniref:Uncharacterized protein n=1 Tax=Portunus trituberculatus TaxID=210409 RepID=A0A5B7K9Y9_PORTR|nr:hypothetical protein [Portunus trituberculatus]